MNAIADTIESSQATAGGTVRFHRVLRASPENVFKAFVTPEALARWLPPRGYTCTVHSMDARKGGTFRMSFTEFASGNSHSFGGEFLDFETGEFLRYTDAFDDPNLPGTMQVTATFRKVGMGTEIDIVQEGIPDVIPLDACQLGWQDSLMFLGLLVEGENAR
ncbi:MAG: SRPBCC family protein [Pseudomonadota bacterium]|nr:SRPBCC family protein [Pseudomonadota bacterium]